MLDIYKEIQTKESYDLKYRFIEKWYKEKKDIQGIADEWLRCIHEYNYKENLEFELDKFKTGKTRHLNFYRAIDLEGEVLSKYYDINVGTKSFYELGGVVRKGTTKGKFSGVEYQALGEGKHVKIVLIDENVGVERYKYYSRMPDKIVYLCDMIFYLDSKYIPAGRPASIIEIINEIKSKESLEKLKYLEKIEKPKDSIEKLKEAGNGRKIDRE